MTKPLTQSTFDIVARASSLLYRGFSTRRGRNAILHLPTANASRLEVGDTAGWKPALRAALLLLFSTLALTNAQALDLTVARGASKQIPVAEGVRKIAVSNPAIIDAKPSDDGKAVVVTAIGEGTSDLRIDRLAGGSELIYKVHVRADMQETLNEIKELLADVEGLEIKTLGEKILLKGNIVTKSDYDKVEKVVGAYGGNILDMTKFDRSGMNKYVEEAILKDLQTIGITTVTVHADDNSVILDGVVYSEGDKNRAMEWAHRRMPTVTTLVTVQDVMIETDVEFIEVSTEDASDMGYNVLKNLGISANGGISGGGTGGRTVSYGVSATASAKINALVSRGNAKILNRQNVSCKSGSEARAMVGGEFGVPVSGNVGGSLEKIQFGVILKVKPVLQGRDTIVNAVSVEVSMPVAAGRNAYSLDKSETQTTSMCKVGESVVLSGLVQTFGNRAKEKTPLVGDVPLLNLFFSEKTSNKSKKEVVVLLTPRPVFPQVSAGPAYGEERKKLVNDKSFDK